jgi:6-phosphogluconolactonase (cycloisomerase 2 family)
MGIPRRGLIGGASAVVAGSLFLPRFVAGASTASRAEAEETLAADLGRVYLGSFTDSGGPGIVAGIIDAATGDITVDSEVAAVSNPSWLELATDALTLYAVSENAAGTINALSLADDANPTPGNSAPTGNGPTHLAVHPAGGFLLTSNFGGGTVAVHPIEDGGAVGPASTVRKHEADAGQTAHAHQVVFDPTGTVALSVDLGTDSVYVETFDGQTGELGVPDRVRFTSGAGPRHLAFHSSGDFVYVANELNSTVTVCRFQNGVLTPGGSLSTLAAASVQNAPSEIVVSADGRFVYVANRGANNIAVFAVAADGAELELIANPPCGGDTPRDIAIAPGGGFLYVANQRSGDVTWLPIDASSGIPGAAAGSVALAGASRIRFA